MARWGIIARKGRFEKRNYYCPLWYVTLAIDKLRLESKIQREADEWFERVIQEK